MITLRVMTKKKSSKTVKGIAAVRSKASKRTSGANRRHGMLSPTNVNRIERRFQVVTMRRDGHTLREIAAALDISEPQARLDLQEVMKYTVANTAETVEENRQLQIERLDNLLKAYMPLATHSHKEVKINSLTNEEVIVEIPPNPNLANVVLSIEARRAKLLALDIPETKKVEMSGIRIYEGVDMDKV